MEQKNDLIAEENVLEVDAETSSNLVETSKWAKFMAVTIFVLAGLILFMFIAFGSFFVNIFSGGGFYSRYGGESAGVFAGIVVAAVLIAGIMVTVYYFLLHFANKTRQGVESQDISTVNKGFRSLKVHYILIGIFSALGLLINLLQLFK